ncbi:MAG: hypothetical protein WA102_10780 [Candidatus Methanoperedens sp.]
MKHKQRDDSIMNLHEIAAKQLKNKDLLKLSEKAKEKSMQYCRSLKNAIV